MLADPTLLFPAPQLLSTRRFRQPSFSASPSSSTTSSSPTEPASPPNLHLDIEAVNQTAAEIKKKTSMASPNAKTREETQAVGEDTFGVSLQPKFMRVGM